ncbi:MAG: DCC1-like thiol-disulfide oxidoreductase family protein [Nitrospinota bacterium]|nr:DCC1-like thiol-disulfide oxidoreductase family protein [Nitrospinota bacterium]
MSENNIKKDDPISSPLVLYDGVCKLCNGSVNFILHRDRKGRLKLAPLQSDYARQVIASHEMKSNPMGSLLLLEGSRLTTKSTAIIRISKYMDGLWPLCVIFLIIPRFIRDFIYDIVANNRYRWFGKYDTCRLPDPEFEGRFYN